LEIVAVRHETIDVKQIAHGSCVSGDTTYLNGPAAEVSDQLVFCATRDFSSMARSISPARFRH
jgi:hypothetical protein